VAKPNLGPPLNGFFDREDEDEDGDEQKGKDKKGRGKGKQKSKNLDLDAGKVFHCCFNPELLIGTKQGGSEESGSWDSR
jgi:hypothetical protein